MISKESLDVQKNVRIFISVDLIIRVIVLVTKTAMESFTISSKRVRILTKWIKTHLIPSISKSIIKKERFLAILQPKETLIR